ncbi:MAG TPA: BrnT family toxin [Stellaceae bacterium]|nr:BrnT family toxin [Stellaceae bacterium]
MQFEWSEAKRLTVLETRGLDFLDGRRLFDGRRLHTLGSRREAEQRWLSIGELDGRLVAIVWMLRAETIRIITMRRARRAEERRYRALYD